MNKVLKSIHNIVRGDIMNFSESKTKENLMRAFAGESQARNRYIFSDHKAKDDGLFVIESIC